MPKADYVITFDDSQVLKSFERIDKSLTSMEKKGDKIFKNMGDKAAKSFDFGALKTGLAGAGIAIAALGVTAAATFAKIATASLGFTDSLNQSMDSVAASTNLSSEELKELKKASLDVFAGDPARGIKAMGNDIVDVTSTMADLQRSTGLTGEALKEAARNALSLRDRFGVDVSKVGAATGAALTAGLEEDPTAIFDLMTAAQARFGERAEDIPDTVQEYSQNFADLGFNAQTTFDFLSRGLEEGARNTDILADGLREFAINLQDAARLEALDEISPRLAAIGQAFADGKITGVDALRSFSKEVKSLDSSLERNEALRLTFGSKFEDIGLSATLALTDVGKSMESIEGQAAKAGAAGTSLAETWDTAMRQFFVQTEPAAQVLLPLLAEGGRKVGEFFKEAAPVFLEFAENLQNTVGPAALLIEDAVTRIAVAFGLVEEGAEGMDVLLDMLDAVLDLVVTTVQAVALLAQGIAFLVEGTQKLVFNIPIPERVAREPEEPEELASSIDEETEATKDSTKAKRENAQARQGAVESAIKAAAGIREAAQAEEEAVGTADDLTDAQEKVAEAFDKLDTAGAQKELENQIEAERAATKAAVDNARAREGIARDNAQAIKKINRGNAQDVEDATTDLGREDAALARKQGQEKASLEQDLANQRVDIETEFHKKVQNIQQQFELSAVDAARTRDATAFLKAQRTRDVALGTAGTDREQAISELQVEGERRREELNIQQGIEREEQAIANEEKLEDLRVQHERELEAQRVANAEELEEQKIKEAQKNEDLATARAEDEEDLKRSLEQKKQALELSLADELALIKAGEAAKTQVMQQESKRRIDILKREQQQRQQASQQGRPFGGPGSRGLQGRAEGGPVTKGVPVIVGELGRPEVFVPPSAGTIIPIEKLQSVPEGLGATSNSFTNNTFSPSFELSNPAVLSAEQSAITKNIAESVALNIMRQLAETTRG